MVIQASWPLMRRILREGVRPYVGRILLSLFFMAIVAITTALTAWLMDPVVNKVFVDKDAAMLWPVAIGVLVTFVIKGFATYIQSTLLSYVGFRIVADMQNRLFAHLMRMDLAFYHNTNTGKLISRLTNDVNLMRSIVSSTLTSLGKDTLSVLFLIGVTFYQDWILASVSFVVFPIAILPIIRLGRRMRKVTANIQEHMGQFLTLLDQSFTGIRVVRAYGMEVYERGKIVAITDAIVRLLYKAVRVRSASGPIMETLGGMAVVIVVLYGGSRVINGETTAGAFFSFIAALLMAYQPIKSLASLNASIQEGLAAAQRIFDLLAIEPSIVERSPPIEAPSLGGTVRFEHVYFTYDGGKTVLDDLDLDVPAGRTVALVGASGAGKSTVLNLIPRFYDVTDGKILVDGVDVRDMSLATLRSRIALVSQEVMLFDDSVRANIAYGRFGATDEEIEAAAKAAAAHDFIMELPCGYDTLVGEMGVRLSGGQRQRLSIARAILKNAPILLLDEATSALDTESEKQVQGALNRLMQGRTTVVIAHRLSTVSDAHVIHVMDQGRIIESGDHRQLLQRDGVYARLYALQFVETEQAVR